METLVLEPKQQDQRLPEQPPKPKDLTWLGAFLTLTLLGSWYFYLHNRTLSIHEGWFAEYGALMRDGRMPYRDFYFFTQPLSLWISRAILEFGDSMVYFRVYGALERLAISALLFAILRRTFSTAATVSGVLAGSVVFATYASDVFFSYLYTTLLFLLISFACLQRAWQRQSHVWLFAAGTAAAWAFFAKQSSGLLSAFAIGVAVILATNSIRQAVRDGSIYIAGLLVGSIPFLAWLVANGAFDAYLEQVFIGAKNSKGSLSTIFFGFFARELDPVAIALYVLLVIPIYRARRTTIQTIPDTKVFALLAVAALVTPLVWIEFPASTVQFWLNYAVRVISRFALYTMLIATVWLLVKRLRLPALDWQQKNALGMVLFTAAWLYGCGMSFSVDQQSAIPGLALVIAYLYDRVRPGLALGCVILCLFLGTSLKWNVGFSWLGWRQAMTAGDHRSHWPQLAGYRLPAADAKMFDEINDEIAKYVGPRDILVTTPQIPMFNFIHGKHQPFFAPVHCWDVCNDKTARRDAETMRSLRPRMIVQLDFDEQTWRNQEESFRNGALSGQRDLARVIAEMTRKDYRQIREYETSYYKQKIRVWLLHQAQRH